MNDPWSTLEALITVRTYPAPSGQHIESSCTAGITRTGEWVRLYPIPYRLLDAEQQFKKFQWIQASTRKATTDSRVESRRVNEETLRILSGPLSTQRQWAARRRVVMPMKAESMCWLQAERDRTQKPTLGFIKPSVVRRFRIEQEDNPNWSEAELAKLRQASMFRAPPAHELEKIPFKFSFEYRCEAQGCGTHNMMCSDWELAELYRGVRHWPDWRERIQKKIAWMIEERDLHFFVGTLSDYPSRWIIIGLWYPPLSQQGVLLL